MNTLKILRRRWTETPAAVEEKPKRMPIIRLPGPKGPIIARKKPQATILRRTTARRLHYLVLHGLMEPVKITPLDICHGMPTTGLVVARGTFRQRDPITGEITTEKIYDESPTCGV